MKYQWILALLTVVFLAPSCKEEEKEVSGTHIFWFDKSTSDSLTANGYQMMEVSIPFVQLKNQDLLVRQASLTEWDNEQPSFQGAALVLRHSMNVSDTVSLEYFAVPNILGAKADFTAFDRLKNSSGTLQLRGGVTTYTKLEWQ